MVAQRGYTGKFKAPGSWFFYIDPEKLFLPMQVIDMFPMWKSRCNDLLFWEHFMHNYHFLCGIRLGLMCVKRQFFTDVVINEADGSFRRSEEKDDHSRKVCTYPRTYAEFLNRYENKNCCLMVGKNAQCLLVCNLKLSYGKLVAGLWKRRLQIANIHVKTYASIKGHHGVSD